MSITMLLVAFVAIGNLCLGYTLAAYLGFGPRDWTSIRTALAGPAKPEPSSPAESDD